MLTKRGHLVVGFIAGILATLAFQAMNAEYERCMAKVNDYAACSWG